MTVKYTKQEVLASEIGTLVGQVGTINATIDEKCQAIRKLLKGKKIGTVKSGDAIMIRFKEAQEKLGKLKEQTIKNNLTTFRKAINDGKAYDVNANRKAKGAQTNPKGKSASASTIRLEVKGDPAPEELAGALRKFFNKLKGSDKYAVMMSFLLDGLDENDGE